jgi:transposase
MRIRTTKTSSGATAIQVVEYIKRKTVVLIHIGSAVNDEEIRSLRQIAGEWILKNNPQLSLFPLLDKKVKTLSPSLIAIDKCQYLGFRYQLLYDVLSNLSVLFKFHLLPNYKIFTDLVIARISSPGSKIHSLEFLNDFFGINHQRRELYRLLPQFVLVKDDVESRVINIAKKHFAFNFSLVFYDLTTLYFESFESDDLRKIGFSKDNKANQPQIMIGLLVNDSGFPISYQVFEGNKFEGHTLMPSILAIRKKHKIEQMNVVADAAMISDENVAFLKNNDLSYIVGARVANLSIQMIEKISRELNQIDDATIRINTPKGKLICHFASNRYRKDKIEMEKQINKAKFLLKESDPNPARKRTKFLKHRDNDKNNYELNAQLINKTNLLLGIKGYYSNLDDNITDQEIIKQYRNLWHVEQAFRISKSDLKMRPVFHFKQHSIKAHLLICFMALAICKFIEIKTGKSIKAVLKLLKGVTEARILDKTTKKEFFLRSEIKGEVREILGRIEMSY